MKKEEITENEKVEEIKENTEEKALGTVKSFSDMMNRTNTIQDTYTNIRDEKKIFNLDTNVDYKLNDCKGQLMRVKEVLIKRFEKVLDEPIVNEETGEIKETEIKMVTILIDDNNKSYVTASKIFTMQMMRYIQQFGTARMEDEGLEIKIIERSVKGSNNKALGFELV